MILHNKTILIIDDDPDFRHMISKIIDGSGNIFHEAANLNEAKFFCKDHPPHLILLDLHLNNEEGQDFLKYRIKNKHLQKIPLIVFSMENNKSTIISCLELMADDYLLKPVSASTLLQRINILLKKNDNLSYLFKEEIRPMIKVTSKAELIKLSEVGCVIRAPIKITQSKEVNIISDFLNSLFTNSVMLNSTGTPTTISPGLYMNEFFFCGLDTDSYTNIRKVTAQWRTR